MKMWTTSLQLAILIAIFLLLCTGLTSGVDLTGINSGKGLVKVPKVGAADFLKQKGIENHFPHLFLSTKYKIAQEVMSNPVNMESDHIPPKSMYKKFGDLIDPADVTHKELVRKLGLHEGDLPCIVLLKPSHRGFFTTGKPPSSIQTAKTDNAISKIKMMELSKNGQFVYLLTMNMNGYDIDFVLAPMHPMLSLLPKPIPTSLRLERFHALLEVVPSFNDLDDRSKKIVLEAFSTLPTSEDIEKAKDLGELKKKYVDSKLWTDPGSSYDGRKKALEIGFKSGTEVKAMDKYDSYLLMSNQGKSDRAQTFMDYLKKTDLHQDISKERLINGKLTMKTGEPVSSDFISKLQKLFKNEFQYTAAVDTFEYMKDALRHILDLCHKLNLITSAESDNLKNKFNLNKRKTGKNTDELVSERLKRPISPLHPDDKSHGSSVEQRLKDRLGPAPGQPAYPDELIKKHYEIYEERLTHQTQVGNFAQFTPEESGIRAALVEYIEQTEKKSFKPKTSKRPRAGLVCGKRTKRSVGASSCSCVFCIAPAADSENIEGRKSKTALADADILEVNSKKVVDVYKESSNAEKQYLMEIVEANRNKIVGDTVDVDKVHSLVEYEKLHDHSNRVKFAEDISNPEKSVTDMAPSDGRDVSSKPKSRLHVNTEKVVKKFKPFTRAADIGGAVMLASSLTKALADGDKRSLAIMGGRVGGETFLSLMKPLGKTMHTIKKPAVKLVTRIFADSLKKIGKAAGPLGELADAGMGIWGILEGVKVLNDPNASKFDRKDAIADIVENSISTAVSVASAGLLIAFPPAAPLIAAVSFFFNLFVGYQTKGKKADNHIERLESEITLFDWERTQEWRNNLNKKNTSSYLLRIIKAKDENKEIIRQSVKLLEENQEMFGRITSASTSKENTNSNCHQECWHVGYFGVCKGYHRVCDTRSAWETESNSNAYVDLRHHQHYYRDRSSPEAWDLSSSEFTIFCSPGSRKYRGDKISWRSTSLGFVCENAIGVERKVIGSKSKYMYIDLESGDDTVYSSDKKDVFFVQNGNKTFYAGAGDDIFNIVTCNELNGILDGEEGFDLVQFQKDCPAVPKIIISLSVEGFNVQLADGNFVLRNIEIIYGSKISAETIYGAQEFDYVDLRGTTSSSQLDVVEINGPPKVMNKDMEVRVSSFTRVKLISYGTGTVNMRVPTTYRESFVFELCHQSTSSSVPNALIILEFEDLKQVFFSDKSRPHDRVLDCNVVLVFNSGKRIQLEVKVQGTPSVLKQLYANVNVNMLAGIYLTKNLKVNLAENSVEVNHHLQSTTSNVRHVSGVENSQNCFHLIQGIWNVDGKEGDTFIVSIGQRLGGTYKSRGGKLGISPPFNIIPNSRLSFSFETGSFRGPLGTLMTFTGITEFFGASGIVEDIHCDCTTNLVRGDGGSISTPDTIYYNSTCYDQTPLTIIAMGTTNVFLSSNLGNRSVQVEVTFDEINGKTQVVFDRQIFTMGTYEIGKAQVILPISTSEVESAQVCSNVETSICFKFFSRNSHSIQFRLRGVEKITTLAHFGEQEYLDTGTDLFFAPNGNIDAFVVIRPDTLLPEFVHDLDMEKRTNFTVQGVPNFTNAFLCHRGTWSVFGSDQDDRFIILSTQFSGKLDGRGGLNILIIDPSITDEIEVSLGDKGFFTTALNTSSINVKNMGRLEGRPNLPEKVIVNNNVQFVNTRGGSEDYLDSVLVEENLKSDQMNLTIVINANTNITNNAGKGQYLYVVNEISNIHLIFNESGSSRAHHVLKFQVTYTMLDEVSFAEDSQTLALKFGEDQVLVPFHAREDNGDRNAIIQFVEDKSVNLDISMLENGLIRVSIRPPAGQLHVSSVLGANNFVYINGSELCLTFVVGADKNDVFVVSNDACIDHLHGGLPGTLNTLTLQDFHESNYEDVIVNLVSSNNGSVDLKATGLNTTLIKKVENIRKYVGPNGARSQVYIGCETSEVENAAIIHVTDYECRHYDVNIWIQPQAKVIFRAFPPRNFVSAEFTNLPAGTVRYHFQTLQSFDVSTDWYSEIFAVKHVFYLPIQAKDIDGIELLDMKIKYTVRNETYSHQIYDLNYIDEDTETNFQFFSNPRLVLSDGFNIQVDPFGKVFLVLPDGNAQNQSTEQLISTYTLLAAKLQVNILVYSTLDFIYFACPTASKSTDDEDQRAKDVISNFSPQRSHLVGGTGAGGTVVYMITDLQKDVHVHPYAKSVGERDEGSQVIDLRSVMARLENNRNGTKYIPSVTQDGNSLVVSMEGYESEFPAKIVIHNALSQVDALRVRLRVYLMRFECDNESEWKLKPVLITIPEGTVATITADDVEAEQKFVFATNTVSGTQLRRRKKRASEETTIDKSGDAIIARNGNNVLFTTLSSRGSETGSTLILLDIPEIQNDQNGSVQRYNNAQIFGNNVSWTLNGGNIIENNEIAEENFVDIKTVIRWSDILEELEDELLHSMPEIPRSFQQNAIWFNFFYWGFVAIIGLLIILLVIVSVVFFGSCKFCDKSKSCNPKHSEATDCGIELRSLNNTERRAPTFKTIVNSVDSTVIAV